jgi:hypothetical protein
MDRSAGAGLADRFKEVPMETNQIFFLVIILVIGMIAGMSFGSFFRDDKD